MYRLSKFETETHIRFDAEEKVAHIWTCDPIYIRKLDKLCQNCSEYKVVRREAYANMESVFYEAPAKLVSFRTPINRVMSDEQRDKVRQNISKAIAARRNAQNDV